MIEYLQGAGQWLQPPTFIFLCKAILLVSLWCNGVYVTSREKGDALHFLLRFGRKLPDVLEKPFIGCINCMASFHGAYVLAAVFIVKGISFQYYLVTFVPLVVVCAFLNGILILVYNTLEKKLWLQTIAINKQSYDDNRSDSGTDPREDTATAG